jgi:uncharacterized phage-associated protein
MAGQKAASFAARLLELAQVSGRSDVTQLKLHKLVTLVQSLNEYALGEAAFRERVIALTNGPIVSNLLDLYQDNKKQPITVIRRVGTQPLDDVSEKVVSEVWAVAGHLPPGGLWELSHRVGPWRRAHDQGDGTEIPLADLGRAWPDYVAMADQLTQYRGPHPTPVVGRGQSGFSSPEQQRQAMADFRPSRIGAGG